MTLDSSFLITPTVLPEDNSVTDLLIIQENNTLITLKHGIMKSYNLDQMEFMNLFIIEGAHKSVSEYDNTLLLTDANNLIQYNL